MPLTARRAALAGALAAVISLVPGGADPHTHPIPSVPGGLRQYRASQGPYLSYSEPHVSVNPRDPNHFVAASKQYQNLERYLFKVGTYVSFDGGRTWRDNGHLPGYPRQRGDEDRYHITSDPWTAFDDEGNAYVMVLDASPRSATGAGWGMTLHRSTDGGLTWSRRIPIHEYGPGAREVLLDDKNALAIDNSGPDGDGVTGAMYACWSLDTVVSNLAIVVTRSTDGGGTWSQPVPVSAADRSVIGCQIAIGPPATRGGPGVVTVIWYEFTFERMRATTSSDGGTTWSPPVDVARVRSLPGAFRESSFRVTSLPTAAADPRTGTLYVAWADWHRRFPDRECPEHGGPPANVCDADIVIARSRDRGATWSRPRRVNRDRPGNGADQFMPALAVTPRGQLNMMWFDRRNDRRNLYIDTYFARSNDGGRRWRETRVTRRMWDPRVNPPRSSSGDFIGDYQGLAASDAFAVPFWNDTTLAWYPSSDPRHSPYQQVFAAHISNTPRYGGPR